MALGVTKSGDKRSPQRKINIVSSSEDGASRIIINIVFLYIMQKNLSCVYYERLEKFPTPPHCMLHMKLEAAVLPPPSETATSLSLPSSLDNRLIYSGAVVFVVNVITRGK